MCMCMRVSAGDVEQVMGQDRRDEVFNGGTDPRSNFAFTADVEQTYQLCFRNKGVHIRLCLCVCGCLCVDVNVDVDVDVCGCCRRRVFLNTALLWQEVPPSG